MCGKKKREKKKIDKSVIVSIKWYCQNNVMVCISKFLAPLWELSGKQDQMVVGGRGGRVGCVTGAWESLHYTKPRNAIHNPIPL